MSKCECYKYIYERCSYCEDLYIKSTKQYRTLLSKLRVAKKLYRRGLQEIGDYGKIQEPTIGGLNDLFKVQDPNQKKKTGKTKTSRKTKAN